MLVLLKLLSMLVRKRRGRVLGIRLFLRLMIVRGWAAWCDVLLLLLLLGLVRVGQVLLALLLQPLLVVVRLFLLLVTLLLFNALRLELRLLLVELIEMCFKVRRGQLRGRPDCMASCWQGRV